MGGPAIVNRESLATDKEYVERQISPKVEKKKEQTFKTLKQRAEDAREGRK